MERYTRRLAYLATGNDGLHLLKAGPIGAAVFPVDVGPANSLSFSPSTINVNTGDTVNWEWKFSGHSTTSGTNCTFNGPGPNAWDSGILGSGATFQFTFNTAGSFPYFCSPHCFFGMVGTVNVTAVAPVTNISITPAAVSFGNVSVGQTSIQTLTVTNQATSTAALTGSVGDLAAPFSVVSGGGAFNLAAGQSQTVTVQFSPITTGAASTNLSVTHNATNQISPTLFPLSGTGVTPTCSYSILPFSNAFGPAGGSGGVAVTTSPNCSWTASTDPGSWDWIGISSGGSGTGNGTVNYFVLANTTGATRTGILTIAGRTFTVTQSN